MLSNETSSSKGHDFNVMTPGNLAEITKIFGIYLEQINIYTAQDSIFIFLYIRNIQAKTGNKDGNKALYFFEKAAQGQAKFSENIFNELGR